MKVAWRYMVLLCLCVLLGGGPVGCMTCTSCKEAEVKNKAWEEERERSRELRKRASAKERAAQVEADAQRVGRESPTLAKWIRKGRLMKDDRGFYYDRQRGEWQEQED